MKHNIRMLTIALALVLLIAACSNNAAVTPSDEDVTAIASIGAALNSDQEFSTMYAEILSTATEEESKDSAGNTVYKYGTGDKAIAIPAIAYGTTEITEGSLSINISATINEETDILSEKLVEASASLTASVSATVNGTPYTVSINGSLAISEEVYDRIFSLDFTASGIDGILDLLDLRPLSIRINGKLINTSELVARIHQMHTNQDTAV